MPTKYLGNQRGCFGTESNVILFVEMFLTIVSKMARTRRCSLTFDNLPEMLDLVLYFKILADLI